MIVGPLNCWRPLCNGKSLGIENWKAPVRPLIILELLVNLHGASRARNELYVYGDYAYIIHYNNNNNIVQYGF